jgi:hypothetical protein
MSNKGMIYVPPPSSSWSFYNQSSSVATTINNGAINLYMPKHGSANADNFTGYYRTAPSTPYTIIANVTYNAVDVNGTTGTFLTPGLGFTDGTACEFINPRCFSSGYGLTVLYCDSSTHGSANHFDDRPNTATAYPWPITQWYMLRDDGTNVFYYMSNDTQDNGRSWVKLFSNGRTTNFTKSSVGVFWGALGNVAMNCTINSWTSLAV